jgi:FkbM family methyltransferase
MTVRRLISDIAYRGEVLCSRLQGIAYDCPARNGEYLLVRRLSDTLRHAIDIGANVGDWTAEVLRATSGRARVVCVEPDPDNARTLRARFGARTNVHVFEAAVAERAGISRFVTGDGADSGVGYVDIGGAGSIEVPARTLHDIVTDLGDPDVDLVKCDVEGAEMSVLTGAEPLFRRSRIAVMQVEYNATWQRSGRYLRELFEFAADHGYAVLLASPMGFARLPAYGTGLEDFRLRNDVLARQDCVHQLSPHGPSGRGRVEFQRAQQAVAPNSQMSSSRKRA